MYLQKDVSTIMFFFQNEKEVLNNVQTIEIEMSSSCLVMNTAGIFLIKTVGVNIIKLIKFKNASYRSNMYVVVAFLFNKT